MTPLETLQIGGGQVEVTPAGWRLSLPVVERGYADAQLDDYHRLSRSDFLWRPPLVLKLRARAYPETPLGTLGFGFWNDPFSLSMGQGGAARRLPATPQAAWFFYGSPPNDLALDPNVPGHGWKASVLRSPSIPGPVLLPGAALAAGLSLLPALRGPVMRLARSFIQAREEILPDNLSAWHEYQIQWKPNGVGFWVDGQLALDVDIVPRPPLGLVLWIDNQYAVASPQGGFRFGNIPTQEPQWLEIEGLELDSQAGGDG